MRKKVNEEATLLDILKSMQPQASTNVLRKMLTNERITVDEADEIDAITAAHDLFSFQQDEWNEKYEEETLSVKEIDDA